MSSSCFIAVLIVDSREAGETGTFRQTHYNFNIFYAPAIAFSFSFSSLHYVNYRVMTGNVMIFHVIINPPRRFHLRER